MDTDEPAQPQVSREDALAAIERRKKEQTVQRSAAQMQADRELKTKFRRMLDPGIVRPNSHEQAVATMKILLTLSDNLLKDPDNPKFQRFKPTNSMIKRNLVDPKGGLEYAIEMGFRPIVENFQPYYVWSKRSLEKLTVGTSILREHISLEDDKAERLARAKQEEAKARLAEQEKVKMAFLDDRLSKERRDELEREARQGRALAAAQSPPPILSTSSGRKTKMPGAGVLLSGEVVPAEDNDEDSDDDGESHAEGEGNSSEPEGMEDKD